MVDVDRFSRHARERMQQRGIRLETIRFILDFHDADIHVGNGRRSIYLSRSRLEELKKQGAPVRLLERAEGIIAVLDDVTGEVVSVLHDRGRRARPYRRQHRNGHRRHRTHRRVRYNGYRRPAGYR